MSSYIARTSCSVWLPLGLGDRTTDAKRGLERVGLAGMKVWLAVLTASLKLQVLDMALSLNIVDGEQNRKLSSFPNLAFNINGSTVKLYSPFDD